MIIELFEARDESAIAALTAKYGKTCNRISQNILKNALDAEEVVNDTYLAVWNAIPPQKPDPLQTFVFRIVRNLAIAKYHANTAAKRNSHYDMALDELEECFAGSITIEEELQAKELSRQIDLFLESLDQENRVIFVRRYWYSDSVGELATRFHISPNTVSVRLSRMRDKLKKHLKKVGYER